METKQKKTLSHYMRALHRDIGFFVIGITFIYCLSGIVLVYRDTDLLKREVNIEKILPADMDATGLAVALRMKNFKVIDESDDVIHFNNGTYNKQTGIVNHTDKVLPDILSKFIGLHKTVSKSTTAWPAVIYGVLLLFLAISSFWMYKPGTKKFKRGIIITLVGVVVAIILLL